MLFAGGCGYFLFISMIDVGLSTTPGNSIPCPENLPQVATGCIQSYEKSLRILDSTKHQTFYTGVDMETIRIVCTEYLKSMKCIRALKSLCPQDTHQTIDNVVNGVSNVEELCTYRGNRLYEEYALHQSCYVRARTNTTRCHQQFLSLSDKVYIRAVRGKRAELSQWCGYIDTFLACIRDTVTAQCSRMAAKLANVLVVASLDRSKMLLKSKCSHGGLKSPTTLENDAQSDTSQQNGKGYKTGGSLQATSKNENQTDHNKTSIASRYRTMHGSVTTALTLLVWSFFVNW